MVREREVLEEHGVLLGGEEAPAAEGAPSEEAPAAEEPAAEDAADEAAESAAEDDEPGEAEQERE